MLLSLPDILERKATDEVQPFGEIKLGFCCVCQQQAFAHCFNEHPKWFTPKTHRVKLDRHNHVMEYIEKAVKPQLCVTVTHTTQGYDYNDCEITEIAVCHVHLHERTKHLHMALMLQRDKDLKTKEN